MQGKKRVLYVVGFLLTMFTIGDIVSFAQGASPGYRIDESSIGPGGNLESTSSGFRLEAGQQAVGNGGAVNAASTTFQTQGGNVTASEPRLICVVDAAAINFGAFSPGSTQTATATFRVLNYTAYGYSVNIIGPPPQMGGYTLIGMNPSGPSQVGTEQFGINLVANTSPSNIGAFPQQIPDNTFSFGDATPNYITPNTYRYISGESIAFAPKSSGETAYTISYIVNVSAQTPGGTYRGNNVILCTGTY